MDTNFTIKAEPIEQKPMFKNEVKSESKTIAVTTNASQPTYEVKQQPVQQMKQPEIYGPISEEPLFTAVEGIKYDFNKGIRVLFPKNDKTYHVTFLDVETNVILFSQDVTNGAYVTSVKKFYVPFKLIIHKKDGDKVIEKPIFEHTMNLKGKDVMIQVPKGAVGDTIAWFSYAERFQQKHQCNLIVAMDPVMSVLFKKQYKQIRFIDPKDTMKEKPYASYYMGLFFRGDIDNQPIDFRYIGLHRTAGYILGLREQDELADLPPRVDLTAKRKIKEKYVCIAAQSSSMAKYWNNPFGWMQVVKFLKEQGYRVLCIDKMPVVNVDLQSYYIPYGAEDFTGDIPLQERINLIKDADFFVGLSSGLSWIAWCCKVPVVMISGFTHPTNEFYTPYRVINYHACHSCWNDMRENFDHFDFRWCPRHKGDKDRQFECTRLISAEQVINTIKKIPTFKGKEK